MPIWENVCISLYFGIFQMTPPTAAAATRRQFFHLARPLAHSVQGSNIPFGNPSLRSYRRLVSRMLAFQAILTLQRRAQMISSSCLHWVLPRVYQAAVASVDDSGLFSLCAWAHFGLFAQLAGEQPCSRNVSDWDEAGLEHSSSVPSSLWMPFWIVARWQTLARCV